MWTLPYGIPEAVEDHPVDELGVAHAVAGARAVEVVGGVRHRLHAARDDDVRVAQRDRLGRRR